MWLQVYIIIVSWYSVFEDKLFENSENKIKDEYIRIEKQYSETGGGKMKSIGKPICTILLTVALIFTFAPWTGAMNEAYAATDTIQSVNISCDIPAIGLKEGRTEKQVYQIIDYYSKCTTTGVVVRSSYDLTFWDEPWDRFTSTTSRDNFVDPALQYYLSQSLFAADDYAWPNNVKQATSWTKVSSLAGFKITLNNVNCDAAVIRYVEVGGNRWLDVNIPIGNEISKSTVVVYPNAADYSGGHYHRHGAVWRRLGIKLRHQKSRQSDEDRPEDGDHQVQQAEKEGCLHKTLQSNDRQGRQRFCYL